MKEFDKKLLQSKEKIKARGFYHKYGYAISALVLNDIISIINPDNKYQLRFYKKVKELIENKDLE